MALQNNGDEEFDKLTDEDKAWLASLPEEGDYEDGELGVTTVVFYKKPPAPAQKAAGVQAAPPSKPAKPKKPKTKS